MNVSESYKYKECFKKLPLLTKNKTIKIIKQLKKSSSITDPIIVGPIKDYDDTYRCRIDKDYSFVFLLDGLICMLLSVGKNEEDLTR